MYRAGVIWFRGLQRSRCRYGGAEVLSRCRGGAKVQVLQRCCRVGAEQVLQRSRWRGGGRWCIGSSEQVQR